LYRLVNRKPAGIGMMPLYERNDAISSRDLARWRQSRFIGRFRKRCSRWPTRWWNEAAGVHRGLANRGAPIAPLSLSVSFSYQARHLLNKMHGNKCSGINGLAVPPPS